MPVETPPAAPAVPAAPAAPAPAAPAAPAPAASAAPAAPAAPVAASLLDVIAPAAPAPATPAPNAPPKELTPQEKIAAAEKVLADARAAADPNSGLAWNLDSTTPGTGAKPVWLKSDKYKSVAAQAEAYVALESRLGSFVGAPKDGKYEFKMPENLKGVSLNLDHPLMKDFSAWAAKAQLSPEGYNELLGRFVAYEASQAPDMNALKVEVGTDADVRIGAVNQWANANLDAKGVADLRASLTGRNAPAVFRAFEALIAKTTQARMPKPGDDVAAPGAGGLEAINAMQAKVNDKGQRLVDVDPKYRAQVFAARQAYFEANPVKRDRQGNLRA